MILMNILKLAAEILLFYILYRIVVNFVIPAYRSVKKFREQFTQMQQNMQQQFEKTQVKETPPQPEEKNVEEEQGEYIDFEEIKN